MPSDPSSIFIELGVAAVGAADLILNFVPGALLGAILGWHPLA